MWSRMHPVGRWVAVVVMVATACSGAPPVDSGPPPVTAAPAATATAPTPAAAPTAPGTLEPSEPFGLAELTLASPDGTTTVPLAAYVAADPTTRQRGLMFREQLPATAGMVFLFPAEHRGGFWMKDTLIPLSIAFFDADGVVLAVLDMEPCPTTEARCPTYDPQVAYHGALEVNQGYFDRIGLVPGWRVELPTGLADTAV